MLICCSFNSFSIFGHYISARLQIIWRPYLWLVWSFTQMVSFLEFSIPNPVFPQAFFLFTSIHILNATATCLIFIVTNNSRQTTLLLHLSTDSHPLFHASPRVQYFFFCMPSNHCCPYCLSQLLFKPWYLIFSPLEIVYNRSVYFHRFVWHTVVLKG